MKGQKYVFEDCLSVFIIDYGHMYLASSELDL